MDTINTLCLPSVRSRGAEKPFHPLFPLLSPRVHQHVGYINQAAGIAEEMENYLHFLIFAFVWDIEQIHGYLSPWMKQGLLASACCCLPICYIRTAKLSNMFTFIITCPYQVESYLLPPDLPACQNVLHLLLGKLVFSSKLFRERYHLLGYDFVSSER